MTEKINIETPEGREKLRKIMENNQVNKNEWCQLHQWQWEYRKENNLTISEFITKCGDNNCYTRQYLIKDGIERIPSNREGSNGKNVFDMLKIAFERHSNGDFVTLDSDRTEKTQAEILNNLLYDDGKNMDLKKDGVPDVSFSMKEGVLCADISVEFGFGQDLIKKLVTNIVKEHLGCDLGVENISLGYNMLL